MALILIGTAALLLAMPDQEQGPEIALGSAGSALALLAGAAMVIRGRRRK
jgi:hypothetical protein